ncbi:MAG: rhodanese-like domain-containing protein [Pseudomonadota bacterium]
MGSGSDPRVGELSPAETWDKLTQDAASVLIDVRTRAEWTFVGAPDLSSLDRETIFVEWQVWPDMSHNPRFVAELQETLGGRVPTAMMFLCRSGVRSLAAAQATAAAYATQGHDVGCINVLGGFEGDLDRERHRGGVSGWKVAGLPWRQA